MSTFLDKCKANKGTIFKLIVFVFISIICINRTNHLRSYPTGDGAEYVLVTEALYKHKSPDIRARDSWSFKRSFTNILTWDSVYKPWVFDALEDFIEKPDKKFMQAFGGLYVDKNGDVFGYHFFTYSLFNVPARYFCGLLHKNPLSAFKITNAILILITCFILLFYSPFNSLLTCLITISFYFSSAYWYMGWIHSELFTVCLVTSSLWLFFQNKYYISLVIMALAVSQNQPLVLVLIYMALVTLFKRGFNIQTFFKLGLCCFISVLPPIFYYYHYDTFNIIKDAGFLDSQYQTFDRLFSFYFDINQGVILAIPFAILIYIAFWLKESYLTIKLKLKPSHHLFLLIPLIAITYVLSSMINWSHGQAVINRYATWMSAIILIHVFFFISQFKNSTKTFFILLIAISQTCTTLYHESITKWEVSWEHKPIAKWVLDNYPALYNPDPLIFGFRTWHEFNIAPSTSPIIYFGEDKGLRKIMCYKDNLDELLAFGVPKNRIDHFKEHKKSINGWVYINKGEFIPGLTKEMTYAVAKYHKAKKIIIPKIEANSAWFEHVKKSAKAYNISLDSALVVDAFYVLGLEEENKN